MPIEFTCTSCGKRYRVSDNLAGRSATCKKCNAPLRVPQADAGQDDPIYELDAPASPGAPAPPIPSAPAAKTQATTRGQTTPLPCRLADMVAAPFLPDSLATVIVNVVVIYFTMLLLFVAALLLGFFMAATQTSRSMTIVTSVVLFAGWALLLVTYLQQVMLGIIEQFHKGSAFARTDISRARAAVIFVVGALVAFPFILIAAFALMPAREWLPESLFGAILLTIGFAVALPVFAVAATHGTLDPRRVWRVTTSMLPGYVLLLIVLALLMAALAIVAEAGILLSTYLDSGFLRVILGDPLRLTLYQFGFVASCAMIGVLIRRYGHDQRIDLAEWRSAFRPAACIALICFAGVGLRYAPMWTTNPITKEQTANRINQIAARTSFGPEHGQEVRGYIEEDPETLAAATAKIVSLPADRSASMQNWLGAIMHPTEDNYLALMHISPQARTIFEKIAPATPFQRLSQERLIELACDEHPNIRWFAARLIARSMPTGELSDEAVKELASATDIAEKQRIRGRYYAINHREMESRLVGTYQCLFRGQWRAETFTEDVESVPRAKLVVSCNDGQWWLETYSHGERTDSWTGSFADLSRIDGLEMTIRENAFRGVESDFSCRIDLRNERFEIENRFLPLPQYDVDYFEHVSPGYTSAHFRLVRQE